MSTNIADTIFSPPEIATLTTQAIERAQDKSSYKLGIPQIDQHFVMARPGKFVGIIADTSQGKTTLMTAIARNLTGQLKDGEIVVYVTWEDTVEDFGMNDIANISHIPVGSLYNGEVNERQFGQMMTAAAHRAATPLWVIGHSEAKMTSRPGLTMTDIKAAIENLVHVQGKKIVAILYDYLQQVNLDDIRRNDTRLQFAGVVGQMKNYALGYNMLTFCGSQVTRTVQSREWRQPQIHDAMETSNFEHTCDGMLSLWMPSKSDNWPLGKSVQEKRGVNDKGIVVTSDLMLVRILKQKKAKAPVDIALDIVPEYAAFVGYGDAEQYRKSYANK